MPKDIEGVLERLELFFNNNKEIDSFKNFFAASFNILEVDYLPLDFFLKRKAIFCWNKRKYNVLSTDPDSEESLKSFLAGVYFLGMFIAKIPNVSFKDYPYLVNNNRVPLWLLHLKEHKISFYHIHAMKIRDISDIDDYKELYVMNFDEKFSETLCAYNKSTKLKELGNKISELVR